MARGSRLITLSSAQCTELEVDLLLRGPPEGVRPEGCQAVPE
jgi:hypothetical protein